MCYDSQFSTLSSYPQAIVHIDADAFFASVEQASHPQYKGKPLVTGGERGIIAAASYEAKALGIKRGVSIFEAKKLCPKLIVLPTDYETCSIYSKRIFEVMRRFTPIVEEYSIDEAFADITGLRRTYRCSYEEIAKRMKEDVENTLGLTVSLGLSLSKSLAKICSDFRKPSGLVCVRGKHIPILLKHTPLSDIWGIGRNSTALLQKYSLKTANDYINFDPIKIKKLLGKPGLEIWQELRGEYVYKVNPVEKQSYDSISKFRTFTPPQKNKSLIKAFLLRNLESACIKARRYNLLAKEVYITLRTQTFEHFSTGIRLSKGSSNPLELNKIVSDMFEQVFVPTEYRATGIVLSKLKTDDIIQMNLFDDLEKMERLDRIPQVIDDLNARFGKHKIHFAGSLQASTQHQGNRSKIAERKKTLIKGENFRQRLKMPMKFIKV